MAPYQAIAEIFMTAFKALPAKERNTFLAKLLKDNSLREDIMDVAIAMKRGREKTKPFREFLKSISKGWLMKHALEITSSAQRQLKKFPQAVRVKSSPKSSC